MNQTEQINENMALSSAFMELVRIVEQLRGPSGCPWDREQTHASLTRFAIEEAFELAEAIDQGSDQGLREELGDCLFQVMLHSQIAREDLRFSLEDVIKSLNAKMLRRHPHVFGDKKLASAQEVERQWEKIKQSEKPATNTPNAPGTPQAGEHFPALIKALKIGLKSEKWKFDWEKAEQVFAKVQEETNEVLEAIAAHDQNAIEEELGDLLFAVAQWARHVQVDPEAALRKANRKFERRFARMIEDCALSQEAFSALPLVEKEKLWQETKMKLKHK